MQFFNYVWPQYPHDFVFLASLVHIFLGYIVLGISGYVLGAYCVQEYRICTTDKKACANKKASSLVLCEILVLIRFHKFD